MLSGLSESDPTWLQKVRGRFVVFDGRDGSGKTTQFRRLHKLVTEMGIGVCEVREPGGTYIGERIRHLLLDPTIREEVDVGCEMLLFMASRSQLIGQRVAPALQAGELVLADRFISSTIAYQGHGGGMPTDDIMSVGKIALGKHWPDLVVVFDVDETTAQARQSPLLRRREFAEDKDRMEAKDAAFHERVRQGYLAQAKLDPDRHLVIDARPDADTVTQALLAGLQEKAADW